MRLPQSFPVLVLTTLLLVNNLFAETFRDQQEKFRNARAALR